MKVLLTGGGGFVGLNIAEALLRGGHHVVVVENAELPAHALSTFGALPGNLQVLRTDITSADAVGAAFSAAQPGHVIHAAAITPGPARELREYGRIIDVNIKGTANVLRAALECKAERVVYVSSGSAYGEALGGPGPLVENETAPIPDTLYAITKFAAERLCARFRESHGLDATCLRLGSVFGPWEFDTGVRDTLSLPLQILRRAMRGEEVVFARREPRRDWVYSRDVAAGVVRALEAPAMPQGLYNLASGFAWENVSADWCACLSAVFPRLKCRMAGVTETANVSFLGERDRALMCIERVKTDIGFDPAFDRSRAFADYLAWVREHAAHFYAHEAQGKSS